MSLGCLIGCLGLVFEIYSFGSMVSKATFSRWKIAIMEMVKKLLKANPPPTEIECLIRCFHENPNFPRIPSFTYCWGFPPSVSMRSWESCHVFWIRAVGFAFQFARQAPCGNTCRFWAFCFFIASGAFCYWTIGTDSTKKRWQGCHGQHLILSWEVANDVMTDLACDIQIEVRTCILKPN